MNSRGIYLKVFVSVVVLLNLYASNSLYAQFGSEPQFELVNPLESNFLENTSSSGGLLMDSSITGPSPFEGTITFDDPGGPGSGGESGGPPDDNNIPLDGGLSILIAVVMATGSKKINRKNPSNHSK